MRSTEMEHPFQPDIRRPVVTIQDLSKALAIDACTLSYPALLNRQVTACTLAILNQGKETVARTLRSDKSHTI